MNMEKIKKLATIIAEAEVLLQTTKDEDIIRHLQNDIEALTNQISSIEEMCLIDDMVQEILEKNS